MSRTERGKNENLSTVEWERILIRRREEGRAQRLRKAVKRVRMVSGTGQQQQPLIRGQANRYR